MNPGVVDGMSVDEIKARFPDEWDKKINEPYSHRFPRAESYHDLSVRLEPIIFELERAVDDVLIIGQSSVLRCLIAYLQGRPPNEIPSIQMQEGELIEISPQAYGVKTEIHKFWDADAKRQERDATFLTHKQKLAEQHNTHEENLPDWHQMPLDALETTPTSLALQGTGISPRLRSTSSGSSTTTEPGERADVADNTISSKPFRKLSLEEYEKMSKEEQRKYDEQRARIEQDEQASLPYQWSQTLETVSITTKLPTGTRARDLSVSIKRTALQVRLKKETVSLIDDELFAPIKEEDSTWSTSDGQLDIHLEKISNDRWWPHALKGAPQIDTTKISPENSRLSDLDGETRAMVEKMMFDNRQKQIGQPTSDQVKQQEAIERFKAQHPEMDFSNTRITS